MAPGQGASCPQHFQPHKRKICFWLTQLSFMTTLLKYTIGLLLSASKNTPEMKIIGGVLIGMDIFFMASSIGALFFSLLLLHRKLKQIREKEQINQANGIESDSQSSSADSSGGGSVGDGGGGDSNNSSVRVVPINNAI